VTLVEELSQVEITARIDRGSCTIEAVLYRRLRRAAGDLGVRSRQNSLERQPPGEPQLPDARVGRLRGIGTEAPGVTFVARVPMVQVGLGTDPIVRWRSRADVLWSYDEQLQETNYRAGQEGKVEFGISSFRTPIRVVARRHAPVDHGAPAAGRRCLRHAASCAPRVFHPARLPP
jgi:hypothetical protein